MINERIQELLKQAGTDVSGKWMNVENAEKFAGLKLNNAFKNVDSVKVNPDKFLKGLN